MDKSRLYINLKKKICANIFNGVYKDGENIPPERTLAENFNISRVTVRKALGLLQNEGILESVQGSGNIVKLQESGYEGTMDIIALLAPAQNPFFSTFIDYFQRNAEENDSLVLFKQNPKGERVEDSVFKLLQKDIRNVVIWLEDLEMDIEYIRRLRGLGMNMVFFDISHPMPYADCVLLDNHEAITTLYEYLLSKGATNIGYTGWDNIRISSVRERESRFTELCSNTPFRISWSEKNNLISLMEEFAASLKNKGNIPHGIICGDGEIGIALKKAFLTQGIEDTIVVSVDDFPEAESLSLTVYMQDFDKLAQKVYQCLYEQNTNADQWKSSVYPIRGKLIER